MPPPPRCSCYAVSIVKDGSGTRVSCNCPSSSRLLCKHCWCAIIALGGKDFWGIDMAALRFDAEDSVHETGASTVDEADQKHDEADPPGDVALTPADLESLNHIFALLRTATQDKNASDLDLYLQQIKYCMDSLRRGHGRTATAQTFAHTHQHFAIRNNSRRQEAPVVVQLSGSNLPSPVPAFVSAPKPATRAANRQQPILPLSELRTLLGLGSASVPVPAPLFAAVSASASASAPASASTATDTSAANPPVSAFGTASAQVVVQRKPRSTTVSAPRSTASANVDSNASMHVSAPVSLFAVPLAFAGALLSYTTVDGPAVKSRRSLATGQAATSKAPNASTSTSTSIGDCGPIAARTVAAIAAVTMGGSAKRTLSRSTPTSATASPVKKKTATGRTTMKRH